MLKSLAAAAALSLAALGTASAATVSVEVFAKEHSSSYDTLTPPTLGASTGLTLSAGQSFWVSVDDPLDTWSLGDSSVDNRESTASGLTNFPAWTQDGLTTLYGTLVGRVGSGAFFVIGLGSTFVADAAGELRLFNWDSNDGDNTGSIEVSAAIPLPAGGLLLIGALGGLAALRRRKTAA